jgi:hypothetical protein
MGTTEYLPVSSDLTTTGKLSPDASATMKSLVCGGGSKELLSTKYEE